MAKFTDGELNVMKILWEYGELKPAEIQTHFPSEIKNSALRSYLTVLLDKGHVQRRMVGKAYRYKAITRSNVSLRHSLGRIVDVFFEGSTEALMMNLIKSEKLSDDDLLQLKRMAEGKSADKSKPKKSKATKTSKRKTKQKTAASQKRKSKRGKKKS